MPQPQNQVPKRVGIGAPVAAMASPLPSRKQSRIGSATPTAAPFNMPLRTLRLLQRDIDILLFRSEGRPGDGSESGRRRYIPQQRLEAITVLAELLIERTHPIFLARAQPATH